jgi:hypothetical protein
MRACRMLVLAVTEHSAKSRWIPWELGFFDGAAGEVFVLPLTQDLRKTSPGIEFLGLYRWLDASTAAATLRAEADRLRNVIHRRGELEVTGAQVNQIIEIGPQILRNPWLALQWQTQIVEATIKLQQAWMEALQRTWTRPAH